MKFSEGDIISGKYKIIRKIGEGSTSTVWLVEDISLFSNVAIKVLKNDKISNRVEDIIRFKSEAKLVS